MDTPFYITTPIYYVNDEPHLGHAYTTVLADVLARYARLQGKKTFFTTGVDEHGQKVEQAARQRQVSPQAYVDGIVSRFLESWQYLHVETDDFIRTTETRHKQVVTTVLQKLWEEDQIYKAEYEGWYCVPDERFWPEKDLVNGHCPDCSRPVERLVEVNYFFRMSQHQDWLIAYIEQHPTFIQPETRRNEVLGFLRRPLNDLCISRPISRLNWGIPLPFDADYVTYVWFDALLNYITTIGYLDETRSIEFERLWGQATHLIGKDILTTHCVYWPTMLQAIGLSQPRTIYAHGWWVVEGQKMSKSLGNALKPLDLAQIYGVDAFRYFLLRDMTLGRDADFSQAALQQRYEGDLANDLGNLLNRVVSMIGRYNAGYIPVVESLLPIDIALQTKAETLILAVFSQVERLAVNEALAAIMQFVSEINRYLEQTAPWQQAKQGHIGRVATILYYAAEALRLASILLQPVLPERMAALWQSLGWVPPADLNFGLQWGLLHSDNQVQQGAPLFPKAFLT